MQKFQKRNSKTQQQRRNPTKREVKGEFELETESPMSRLTSIPLKIIALSKALLQVPPERERENQPGYANENSLNHNSQQPNPKDKYIPPGPTYVCRINNMVLES